MPKFVKPSILEISNYCKEQNYTLDSNHFYDYYESNGWLVGKSKMKDWKATVRNWERRNKKDSKTIVKYDDFDNL